LAIKCLKEATRISVEEISTIYETDAVGGPPQPNFLNGVIKIKTALSPQVLLAKLKEIEKGLGRTATVRFGPRVIDLDILTYGQHKIDTENLTIPHPRMKEREFVLKGLSELINK